MRGEALRGFPGSSAAPNVPVPGFAGAEAPGAAERELQERARRFVEAELIPLEEEAERAGGRLGDDRRRLVATAAIDARLQGGRHRPEHGGQGWTAVQALLVKEQLGRATNGLYSLVPNAYSVLAHGTDAQVRRHLVPALRGEARAAYAVTEEHAGLGPVGDRGRRGRGRRRVAARRREVVRHLRRQRGRVRGDGDRRRGR